ncbi:MAG: 1-acyl-sn-glycerol-3-phosphate acyltransferase [Acidithiobacillus sp.]|nr:hypothetical protein GGI1_24186 [Acidithiobacillus sp. GGI-221]MDA8153770.1 1-acyl-sn-glycerol-3-phosphate acyltransferase [Acidithiobacillus sp.]
MSGLLILARPHTSLLDGPRLAWWLTHAVGMRGALFPIDPDYARHPVWSRLLRTYGRMAGGHRMIALDSESPFGLRTLARALRGGNAVALFPQGTGLREGPDRPDRPGAQWLIRQTCPDVLAVRAGPWGFVAEKGEERHAPGIEFGL